MTLANDLGDAGGGNYALKKLHRFRAWLALSDSEEDLHEANKRVRDKMLFEAQTRGRFRAADWRHGRTIR